MEIIQDKNSRHGLIVTVLVHLLLLLLFLQYGMSYQEPPEENQGGMMINFGTSNDGMGDNPSQETSNPTSENITENTPSSNSSAQEQIVSQNNVETVNVNSSEAEPTQEEEPTIDENLANALNALNNAQNSANTSDGITNTPGNQGNEDGDPNSNNYNGNGLGQGVQFSLSGRSLLSVKKPRNPTQEDGNVVVEIVVDKNGKVIKATPGARGSTTTNPTLYKMAKQAALKARFNVKSNTSHEQKGQMTFVFILN